MKKSQNISKKLLAAVVCTGLVFTSTSTVLAAAKVKESGKVTSTKSLNVAKISFVSNTLTKTGDKTATFKYKVTDSKGTDITKSVPSSDIIACSIVGSNNSVTKLDPKTAKGTLTYNFTDKDKSATVALFYKNSNVAVMAMLNLEANNSTDSANKVDKISFISDTLVKTGDNTATFKYKITNKSGVDITKSIPASDIKVVGNIGSAEAVVKLDPSTGSGALTGNFSDTNKEALIVLVHQGTGITAVGRLKIVDSNSSTSTNNEAQVGKITLVSSTLVKTSSNTATFKYKITDKSGTDITKSVPASTIIVSAAIGSSSTAVSLDPATGTGTLTCSFTSADKTAIITLVDSSTGMAATGVLSIVDNN